LATRRYGTLDGIRGVAALSIVTFHEGPWLGQLSPRAGYLAVDLFFVLSGFVIAEAYEGRLSEGSMTTLGFLKTRAIRFYPLFVAGIILGCGEPAMSLALHRGYIVPVEHDAWWSLVPGLFMLPCPPFASSTALYPLDSVFWSLLFEMLVNVLFVFTRRFWTIWGLGGCLDNRSRV
jgi:peptidoglycan/LPS O-acetylase OafA/YrhL